MMMMMMMGVIRNLRVFRLEHGPQKPSTKSTYSPVASNPSILHASMLDTSSDEC